MNSKSESAEKKLLTKEESEPVKKAVRARAKVPATVKVEPASAEIEPSKAVRARAKVPATAKVEPASAEIEPSKAVRARAKVLATAKVEPASAEIEPSKAVRARAKVPATVKVEPASAEIEPSKAVRARAKVLATAKVEPASAEIEPSKAVRARAKVPATVKVEPAKAVRVRAKVPATAKVEPASAEIEPAKAVRARAKVPASAEIEPAKAALAGAKAPENVEAGLAPIYKIEKEGSTGLFTQKDVKTVIFCLWASTFISIWMAYKAMNQMSNQNWNIILFGSVFFIGVTWFLAVRLKEGRNWARIATIIFAFLSILSILSDKSKYDWTILDLFVIGTDISVIMVLFSRQVSNWFRSGLGLNAPSPESHVKCPDCRELVLRDASKCRHCGCSLIPQ